VSTQHFLYTYLQFIRHNITLSRNAVLLSTMREQLDSGERPVDGKKVVKAQDLVRMYENIIQSLGEIPGLAGLEDDENLAADIEAEVVFYRAFRSYYIALAFIVSQKWSEAMAVFQRSLQYLAQARNNTNLKTTMMAELPKLEQAIESKQFVAHANSILDTEMATDKLAKMDIKATKSVPLVDRLDQYYEDTDMLKGKPNLVNFPPEFSPIPCKPLFFDIALNHVEFPSLDDKLESESAKAGGGGLSGWIWGWGGKK